MRISPPLAILTIVAAAFGILAWREQSSNLDGVPVAVSDARCGAVIAFLKTTLKDEYLKRDGRKLFLTTERARFTLPLDNLVPAEMREEFLRDPFYPLYAQLAESDGVDPRKECASLRDFLKQDDVRGRFTETRPKLRSKDEWDAVFVAVSLPAVTEDGHEAILLSGLTFGLLAGGGSEVYLRKNGLGEWVVKYERSTWIS